MERWGQERNIPIASSCISILQVTEPLLAPLSQTQIEMKQQEAQVRHSTQSRTEKGGQREKAANRIPNEQENCASLKPDLHER